MTIGNRIREARKQLGLNMQEFAQLVGISYITLHRVETDKVSPSVALLSDVAHQLRQPIVSFFDKETKLTIARAGNSPTIESKKLKLSLMIPKGVIAPGITVSVGDTQGGEFVQEHVHKGFELAYQILGKTVFRYGKEEYVINEGDLIYFDGSVKHSVSAPGPAKFITIYFAKPD